MFLDERGTGNLQPSASVLTAQSLSELSIAQQSRPTTRSGFNDWILSGVVCRCLKGVFDR